MRALVFLLLLFTQGVSGAVVSDVVIEHYPTAELFEENTDTDVGRYLIPLGALEIVSHELVPEESVTVTGNRSYRTYYLPDARRTNAVADFYEPQLQAIGEIRYQCSGRTCGSSFYWANTIFEQRILYGPEQYQHSYILELEENGAYLKFYIGQRATRKIYVHIELISPQSTQGD